MTSKGKSGIYRLIEKWLREAGDKPLTCVDLYEFPEIREVTTSSNRVSDYLGHMKRSGLVDRWTSTNTAQRTRYGYTMKDIKPVKLVDVNERLRVVEKAAKPRVIVEENEDGISIDLDHFILTVRRKP